MKQVSGTTIESVPPNVTAEEVAAAPLFRDWLSRAHANGIRVTSVRVLAAHKFGRSPAIRIMHLVATAFDGDSDEPLPGISFLRGDTVDMLALLRVEGSAEEHVALICQARVPGAQARVLSNPAGMIDGKEGFVFAGLRELNEELAPDEELRWRSPFDPDDPAHDMLADVTGSNLPSLVSPGGTDERAAHLVVTATVTANVMARLQRRFTSVEGEDITVVIVPISQLLRRLDNGYSIDGKAFTSALLYQQCRHEWLFVE